MTTIETDANAALATELATGLRALANFIEANPVHAETFHYTFDSINAFVGGDHKAQLASLVRAGLRAGAKVEKSGSETWFTTALRFGPLVSLDLNAHREDVCTRVQVGEETVTRTVKDPEALAAVPEVEVTETVPQYEWKCEPLMGHGTQAVA